MNSIDDRLQTTATRARKLLVAGAGSGNGGTTESSTQSFGPPGEADQNAMSKLILKATAGTPTSLEAQEADSVAATLLKRAQQALAMLENGTAAGSLSNEAVCALEAVMHTRGRPAVRVLGEQIERPDTYPGGEIWTIVADSYRQPVLSACAATAAVHVSDTLALGTSWVQGTAWLIAPDRVITNRHVLFPPLGGVKLARRIPGTTAARIKSDYSVSIDFAFDSGKPRDHVYQVVDVLFVAEDRDPVDAAVLRVKHMRGPEPRPLKLSAGDISELDRLYVIGHPGVMPDIPADVRKVFGDPDERKRISFGEMMDLESTDPRELVHDASTIGGYSGGCVLGFLSPEVWGLHYWGDPTAGNRAFTAAALRRHPILNRYFS